MKNLLAKKLLLIPVTLTLLSLATGCGTPSPIANYTGNAVVKSHNTSGKNCQARVELPDGKTGSVTIGKKSTCTGYKDGATVKIENGKYKGKVSL